jgi:hypothetical protein
MSATATQTNFLQIPTRDFRDWEFVKSLLQDLQAEENREELASLFGQWKLSIKAFRRVEERRMVRQNPESFDLKFHKAGVCHLISFGTMLQVAAAGHQADELAKHGLHKDFLDAILKDLQNTLDEWHGQVPEKRIKELTEKLLNAEAATDLRDSRAEVQTQES